jgi:hypothetical protein
MAMELLTNTIKQFAVDCGDSTFLGIPAWHAGLDKTEDPGGNSCTVVLTDVDNIWQIVLNIADILLRLSIYFAVGFIIYGGVLFVLSQGSPDKIAAAKTTILNAVIGLVLAVTATAIVGYVGGLV